MKDLFAVIGFTIKEMIKRKSFIISTIVILVMIIVGFKIPSIISSLKGSADASKVLIVDVDNVFEGSLKLLEEEGREVVIDNNIKDENEVKSLINNGLYESAIVITENEGQIAIKYIVEDMTMMEGVPEGLIYSINNIYMNLELSKMGIVDLNEIVPSMEFTLDQAEEQEVKGNVFIMMIASLVLFYAIYFCAYSVSTSITTEKTSKVIETLATSTSPKTIVLGKTIGIGIVGLIQMVILVTVAIVSAKMSLDEAFINQVLDVSMITPKLGIITIIYFLLGYITYALLYALTGSTVSKPEDVQSANGPVAIISVIGFYLSYFTMMNPNSRLNQYASILPISSPFCMPFRIMMGLATVEDIIISIGVLIITAIIVAHIAIKIYSNAVLNYGSKLKLKDMFRMYKSS